MKKLILCFAVTLFFIPSSFATKFMDMEMKVRVARANLIVVAEITALGCFDSADVPVAAGKMCTAPGSDNKLTYHLKVDETLYYRQNHLAEKGIKAPKEITFSFRGMSHTSVPDDQYESSNGKKFIFLLSQGRDGSFGPIHEAFFTASLDQKREIKKLIKKKKSRE